MNKRKKKRIERIEERVEKKEITLLNLRYRALDNILYDVMKRLDKANIPAGRYKAILPDPSYFNNVNNSSNDTTKNVKTVPFIQDRLPWYVRVIKYEWSFMLKILKGKGHYGSDKEGWAEVPLPDEIKDYLEDQEIDFQLGKEL